MSHSLSERDRRWALLNTAMGAHHIDALILSANDYRGHKGALRYVADYNLAHRSGHAVMFKGEEPVLVLSGSLAGARKPKSGWVSQYRFARTTAQGLVEALGRNGPPQRVGIVGLGGVMKVDEYLALTRAYPHVEFVDFSWQFETIRSVKSAAEIRGAEESAYILDQCFARLLQIARPGITEREIAAEMYRVGHGLGAEDPLFLTMHTELEGERTISSFGVPRDRVLGTHDIHTFSFEMVGPSGYWTELSRMVCFARPGDDEARMARAVARGIAAGSACMLPDAAPSDVQRAVLDAVESEGAASSYWSGHSLGLDVLEHPWIGLDVVEDAGASPEMPLKAGFVLALHPMVLDAQARVSGYMADSFVVTAAGSRKLSEHPTALHRIRNGEVDCYSDV